MLTAFRALPLLWRVASVAAVLFGLLGALAGTYAYIRHQGYVDGYAVARQECEREKAAQEAANKAAIDKVREQLERAVQEIQMKDAQIDDYIKVLDLAADKDPDGAGLCLGADSVQRLNAIH